MADEYSREDLGRMMREYVFGKFAEGRSPGWVVEDLVRQGIARDMAEMTVRVLLGQWTSEGRTPPSTPPDYYEVLQVSPNADIEVIQAAYRRLVSKHHPDRNPGVPTAGHTTRLLNEAFEILSDPVRRRSYDNDRRLTGATDGKRSEKPDPPSARPPNAAEWYQPFIKGCRDFQEWAHSAYAEGVESVSPSKPRTEWIITGLVFGAFAAYRLGDKCGQWANYVFPITGILVGAVAGLANPHAVEWTKGCNAKDDPLRKQALNSRIWFTLTFVVSIIIVVFVAGTWTNGSTAKPPTTRMGPPQTVATIPSEGNPTVEGYEKAYSEAQDLENRKEFDAAADRFTKAINIASRLRASEKIVSSTLVSRGHIRMYQKDYSRAKSDFDDAIRLDSTNPIALTLRAVVLSSSPPVDFNAVIKDASEAIRLMPELALPYHIRSNAYAWKGDHVASEKDVKEARRLDPSLGETSFEKWYRQNKGMPKSGR